MNSFNVRLASPAGISNRIFFASAAAAMLASAAVTTKMLAATADNLNRLDIMNLCTKGWGPPELR